MAKLSEEMWTSLFLLNREALLYEIDTLQQHLSEYRDALAAQNTDALKSLLREGRILKEEDLARNNANSK